MKKNVLKLFLVVCLLFNLSGCTSILNGWNSATGMTLTPDEVISAIKGVEASINWIIPIAAGVVATFYPESVVVYQVAVAAAKAAMAIADQAILVYNENPTEGNFGKIIEALKNLRQYWNALDDAYKASPDTPVNLAKIAQSQ